MRLPHCVVTDDTRNDAMRGNYALPWRATAKLNYVFEDPGALCEWVLVPLITRLHLVIMGVCWIYSQCQHWLYTTAGVKPLLWDPGGGV